MKMVVDKKRGVMMLRFGEGEVAWCGRYSVDGYMCYCSGDGGGGGERVAIEVGPDNRLLTLTVDGLCCGELRGLNVRGIEWVTEKMSLCRMVRGA